MTAALPCPWCVSADKKRARLIGLKHPSSFHLVRTDFTAIPHKDASADDNNIGSVHSHFRRLNCASHHGLGKAYQRGRKNRRCLLNEAHSAASSSGGRLWPRRRRTSSAASARLVPGPKIAWTPAA